MSRQNKNRYRPLSPEHCEALSKAQHTRKVNKNNKTGHKNIRYSHNHKRFRVEIDGSYFGTFSTLERAISERDARRKELRMDVWK